MTDLPSCAVAVFAIPGLNPPATGIFFTIVPSCRLKHRKHGAAFATASGFGFKQRIRSALECRAAPLRQLRQVEQHMALLEARRIELERMVHECSGGNTADRRVLEVLRDHSECLTEHDEIGA